MGAMSPEQVKYERNTLEVGVTRDNEFEIRANKVCEEKGTFVQNVLKTK